MSAIKQLYRDYELIIEQKDNTNDKITIKNNNGGNDYNNNTNGIGLRINFTVDFLAPKSNKSFLSSSYTNKFIINIYNLSSQNLKKLSSGNYNRISLKCGYRESITGGNSNSQLLLYKASIYKSYTYRNNNDIITTFIGQNLTDVLDTKLDDEDLTKFQKSLLTGLTYEREYIFKYFVDKYLTTAGAILDDKNLTGFNQIYNILDPASGFTFKKGTTISQALDLICGDRYWYIDNLNNIKVLYYPSTTTPYAIDTSNMILLSQETGLLGVPIISSGFTITGKALLNPALTPSTDIKISAEKGNTGFQQSNIPVSLNKTPNYSPNVAESKIMKSSFIGDSISGDWVTTFETYPTTYLKAE